MEGGEEILYDRHDRLFGERIDSLASVNNFVPISDTSMKEALIQLFGRSAKFSSDKQR